VKPETGAQQHRDRGSNVRLGPAAATPPKLVSDLGGEAVRVLGCLREEGGSLTVGQLEAKLSLSPTTLQKALDSLVEERLVARLNTIIPSYSYRTPGSEVHAR
jgi:DNA-binding transcriptional ArsR family regulator